MLTVVLENGPGRNGGRRPEAGKLISGLGEKATS